MEEFKTKYIVKILPNGSQCLSASTGMIETLDKDSNVYEFCFEEECVNTGYDNDNNNHFVEDYYQRKNDSFTYKSNTPYLRHNPISYENNLDKLFGMIHIAAH